MVLKFKLANGHEGELKNVVRLKYSKLGGLLQVFQNDPDQPVVDLNFNEIEVLGDGSAPTTTFKSSKHGLGKSE